MKNLVLGIEIKVALNFFSSDFNDLTYLFFNKWFVSFITVYIIVISY